MKILFFMPSLAGGGAERTIVNILRGLSKAHGDSLDIVLVLGKERPNETHSSKYLSYVPESIKIIYLPVEATKFNLIKLVFSLRNKIKDIKPDLIFSTRLESNLVSLLSSSGLGVPRVIRESNFRSATIHSRALRLFIGKIYNQSQLVISLSKGVLDDLEVNFKVDRSKSVIIYNPIDIENISSSSYEVGRIDDEVTRFVFIGRLSEQKQPLDALEVFSKFHASNPGSTLDILGVGPFESALIERAGELGLSQSVKFRGFVDNPYKYLYEADFLIMTSAYEGFGHVIVEALVCGATPVVYDCFSGPSEILTEELSELLVPVGNVEKMYQVITYLAANSEHHEVIKDLGYERAKDFDYIKISKLYHREFSKFSRKR